VEVPVSFGDEGEVAYFTTVEENNDQRIECAITFP